MKKAKLSLALAAGLVATIGLTSCDEVTEKAGVVLTYTDGFGNTAEYTVKDLFGDYLQSSSAVSTNFDKVYEVMIRKYYETTAGKEEFKQLKTKASNSVNDDMKTAANNAENGTDTDYPTELEKILSGHGVSNLDEDYDYWLYQHEKEHFEAKFYKDHLQELEETGFNGGTAQKGKLNNSTTPFIDVDGVKDEGYLAEKMPYHVRHVLVPVSAESNELCQGKITKDEAKNIANAVKDIAEGKKSFGEISKTYSKDKDDLVFGDLGKMDLDESYVNEFKLGIYAYETLYSNKYVSNDTDTNEKFKAEKAKLAPVNGTDTTVSSYFENKGIGQIPYGAVEALLKAAEVDSTKLEGYEVSGNNESFLPRNIIFNKYFNKHNISVITEDDCWYNKIITGATTSASKTVDEVTNETSGSTVSDLPESFKKASDLKINGLGDKKVLTNKEGNVVLAVRAGASGNYEGIHFIVIERSPLEDSKTFTGDTKATSLAEYWTTKYPNAADFPNNNGTKLTTFVNFFDEGDNSSNSYKDRADKVAGYVKGYNKNISSYIFAWLVNEQSIEFVANDVYGNLKADIKNYIENKVKDTEESSKKSRIETWKTYKEYLEQQDAIRSAGATDGKGYLISETCAIGYLSEDAKNGTGLWAKGGACYHEK